MHHSIYSCKIYNSIIINMLTYTCTINIISNIFITSKKRLHSHIPFFLPSLISLIFATPWHQDFPLCKQRGRLRVEALLQGGYRSRCVRSARTSDFTPVNRVEWIVTPNSPANFKKHISFSIWEAEIYKWGAKRPIYCSFPMCLQWPDREPG